MAAGLFEVWAAGSSGCLAVFSGLFCCYLVSCLFEGGGAGLVGAGGGLGCRLHVFGVLVAVLLDECFLRFLSCG